MKSSKLKYLPNILTFCNMTIGIYIICLMILNKSLSGTRLACYLIYIAAVLDFFDGLLARHLNAVTEMGRQLDSFADFITFGIAPITIFVSNLDSFPWFIIFIPLLYPLAGGFRLVRYNLQRHCEYFTGLPITASGFILATALLINSYFYNRFTVEFIIFYLLLSLTLSIMMVSKIRINRLIRNKIK
jgi:CDP-diacylglycerol--serine O-phosphatidyltransferase